MHKKGVVNSAVVNLGWKRWELTGMRIRRPTVPWGPSLKFCPSRAVPFQNSLTSWLLFLIWAFFLTWTLLFFSTWTLVFFFFFNICGRHKKIDPVYLGAFGHFTHAMIIFVTLHSAKLVAITARSYCSLSPRSTLEFTTLLKAACSFPAISNYVKFNDAREQFVSLRSAHSSYRRNYVLEKTEGRGELFKLFCGDYRMSWNVQRTPHAIERSQTLARITYANCWLHIEYTASQFA